MPDGFNVEEMDQLARTGAEFVELADAASAAHAEFTGAIERHDGANDGFSATGTARGLAISWGIHVDDLSKRAAMTGGLLQDSYDSYGEMESAVIEALERVHPGGGA